MTAIGVREADTAKEGVLGQVVGQVSQVEGSLAEVALVQPVFVLQDFLEESGKKRGQTRKCSWNWGLGRSEA